MKAGADLVALGKENGYEFSQEELNSGWKELQESDEGLTEFELDVVSGGLQGDWDLLRTGRVQCQKALPSGEAAAHDSTGVFFPQEKYPSPPHPVNLTDRRRSVFLTNNNINLGQGWCQSFRT